MNEYQGQGIGHKLINNILEQIKRELNNGEAIMVQLLAADGKGEFYKK